VPAVATAPPPPAPGSPALPCSLLPPAWQPPSPRRLDDLLISEGLIYDIAIRHINNRGVCTIELLASLLKLPTEVAETVFRYMNDHQYLEVRRMTGEDYVFTLSAHGRKLAAERSLGSRYAGPLPVPLQAWAAAVRAQVTPLSITRESLRRGFHDITVGDQFLDALGPALISQSPIFLYGPSGTGKTTVSERLARIFSDAIVVPWALEVDGQIIVLADPAVH
jgi:hypothetical protein